MSRASLAPGFRFHPTDVELVMYYLKRKVMGKRFPVEVVSELKLYTFCPWDLPDKSCLRSNDLEWYFFCPTERKYASGSRMNRATEIGVWKSTGNDRPVLYNGRLVGMIKTLVFHLGHARRGNRTNWVIHEYRLEDGELANALVVQDAYVLCKVFQKSGPGPNNGAQYGAPFNEEDWNDDEEICVESLPSEGASFLLLDNQKKSVDTSTIVPESLCTQSYSEPDPSSAVPSAKKLPPDVPEDDEIASWLATFKEDDNDDEMASFFATATADNPPDVPEDDVIASWLATFKEDDNDDEMASFFARVKEDNPPMGHDNDDVMASSMSMLSEDNLPTGNDKNEEINVVDCHRNNEVDTCSGGNDDMYIGLGDESYNWVEPSEDGFYLSCY